MRGDLDMSWLKEVVNDWPITSAFFTVLIAGIIVFLIFKNRKKEETAELGMAEIEDTKPEPKSRTWTVPEDRQEELWGYWNQWSKNKDYVARYKFWKTTEDLFHETKDIECHFEDGDFVLTIIEGAGDDDDED
jgi:hypothetical protein